MPFKQVVSLRLMLAGMELVQRHPKWVRFFLRPLATAPIVAGFASTISGERLMAREVACKAVGARNCVFEVSR